MEDGECERLEEQMDDAVMLSFHCVPEDRPLRVSYSSLPLLSSGSSVSGPLWYSEERVSLLYKQSVFASMGSLCDQPLKAPPTM